MFYTKQQITLFVLSYYTFSSYIKILLVSSMLLPEEIYIIL